MCHKSTQVIPDSLVLEAVLLRMRDSIRGFLRGSPDCQQLVWYQGRVFKFHGLGIDFPGLTISLAGIKVGIKKLEHATQVAKNLDMYQFQMCKLTHELERDHPL